MNLLKRTTLAIVFVAAGGTTAAFANSVNAETVFTGIATGTPIAATDADRLQGKWAGGNKSPGTSQPATLTVKANQWEFAGPLSCSLLTKVLLNESTDPKQIDFGDLVVLCRNGTSR